MGDRERWDGRHWAGGDWAHFGWCALGVLGVVLAFSGVGLHAEDEKQQDLSPYLRQEDARLGAAAGTIVLARSGRIGEAVTLGRGHALSIRAPITWTATVRLMGDNTIECSPGIAVASALPELDPKTLAGSLLIAQAVQHIRVMGCHVTAQAQSVLLLGMTVSDVVMQNNAVSGMTLAFINSLPGTGASERLRFTGNSVTLPAGGSHFAGLLLTSAKGVVAAENNFVGPTHGIQWWGGDSGAPGAALTQVTQAGQMSFTGNHCRDIGGACIWGSMGYDIEIRGNTADGCGDVCFDTEGGLRTRIVGNTATRCNNGCAAIFFFTEQTMISGNHFRADASGGGLIFIKNASGNPLSHRHLTIEGNELRCLTGICRVMFQEAASEITFRDNEVTNGVWLPVAYARSVSIEENHFRFTRPITGSSAAIAAPAVIGGTSLEVVRNTIDSSVSQPAGVACVSANWSDFNAIDPGLIAGNRCGGPGKFSIGVQLSSTGQNAGLVGLWIVGQNKLDGGTFVHNAPGSHEHFIDLGACQDGACPWSTTGLNAAHSLPGCSGAAPGPTAVCLGGVRGWVTVSAAPTD